MKTIIAIKIDKLTAELFNRTEQMNLLKVHDRFFHVTMPFKRFRAKPDEQPNYMGTGEALVGVLKKDESFTDFKHRYIKSGVERLRKRLNEGTQDVLPGKVAKQGLVKIGNSN